MSAPEFPFPPLGDSQRPAIATPSRYAICIDLDPAILSRIYGASWQQAYTEVTSFLADKGFVRRYGTVYFGNDTIVAVHCMMVVQQLALAFEWFVPAANDVRMIRIEGNNDMRAAMELAVNARRG
jgi:virulence-associated protein VapD